ncbi:hypothetical protein NPIL_222871 [Nephila pilipes]|uniref:Uncharacterized protein n=1 Tax=Nephila pilipes TaxID=299642 RepID=A0A8X6NBI2_NEPPI|nr:hypothetical protein NPIL_273601 [Nephila pilipes]GFT05885.1 hypothetical protein NPIL_602451 [Nephila pilipes]GFT90072.1 hypothetical protein NPIL_680081 [Nephila pilipes]GFU23734.1 hypothetical protein NPIL_222871 [Nephila pilipes]
MESALLLSLVVSLMFAGGNGYSQSMSCSTVNGKTICEKQSGSGNFAGSSSIAGFGQGGTYQDAGAMIGDTSSGSSSSSRTQSGNFPPGGFPMPGVFPGGGAGAFAGGFGGGGIGFDPFAFVFGRR